MSTTANIYSHLDAVTKADTGAAMSKALGCKGYKERADREVSPLYYSINWNLSVPFICQLRTTIKSNQSAILKSFAGKNM
ncbi:MAG: hypothetical protein IJ303_05710, partial [Clostridia bacterium]|nr:hypothetical protein [Clostridia bacterium]